MDFNEVKDLDLWLSSASIGVGCDVEYGWECDFHFYYVPDTIEEDAINEKSCIQVLKHLIAKADAEILDLEDDLAILQSQLSWTEDDEHGKLYELWCVAFREKIKSLRTSLQALRNENAPTNPALNADLETHDQPAERICDIVSALLEHNISTERKEGNSNSLNADIEVGQKTTAESAGLALSRKPGDMTIIGTEKQPVTANFSRTSGLHIPDVRLTKKPELDVLISTSERRERSSTSMPDHRVLDNDVKCGSFALQGTKTVKRPESMLFLQDCEGKDELAPALRAHSVQSTDVKVDFDENETLAMLFNSQGSKGKKLQSNPAISKRKTLEEGNRKKLCMNDTSGASASSKPSPASKGSRRKVGTSRKSAVKKLPLHAGENSDLNSGSARDNISLFALSTEIKDSAMNSHSEDLQRDMNTVENQRQEATVSRNELAKMKRGGLMAIAKNHGLKRYHKLKKSLIVDMITRQIG